MATDPYKILNLPHTASLNQIKKSFRELARRYHPDRFVSSEAPRRREATTKFAQLSAAYGLLRDPKSKAYYDHVYKYGGHDVSAVEENVAPQRKQRCTTSTDCTPPSSTPRKRKSMSIGYTFVDPMEYLCSNGRVQSKAVAGIQIPSRSDMARPNGGLRIAFSSGQCLNSPSGTRIFTTKTTQIADGKKYSKVETTTIHPDGRQEVLIEGNNFTERRYTPPKPLHQQHPLRRTYSDIAHKHEKSQPWYHNVLHELKEKLTMCTNPCVVAGA
jgi:hypothetical protein